MPLEVSEKLLECFLNLSFNDELSVILDAGARTVTSGTFSVNVFCDARC